jgi:hypothetical protein
MDLPSKCNECGCTELRTSCIKTITGKFYYTAFCNTCGCQCGDTFECGEFDYFYD